MEALIINEKEIHSLEELRENFDIKQVMELFRSGRLKQWLEDCFYDEQAKAIHEIRSLNTENVEYELCKTLGVDCGKVEALTPEQQAEYDRKAEFIRKHTDAPDALQYVFETATNQFELAKLIRDGKKTIYLCAASFMVPINISGIRYIGIGNPRMEAAYTEEQYRQAGITFENITLPTVVTEQTIPKSKNAAAINGIDEFADTHGRLSAAFRSKLKHSQLWYVHIPWKKEVAANSYNTRLQAECLARQELDDAYSKSNNFFIPGKDSCLVTRLAEKYALHINKSCENFIDRLMPMCSAKNSREAILQRFKKLLSSAETTLREKFEYELRDNASFYEMFKKSYFLGKLEIMSTNSNPFNDGELMNFINNFIYNKVEKVKPYSAPCLYEIVQEMENDVNSRANTLFSEAQKIYREYCVKIENLAEELSEELSDEEINKLVNVLCGTSEKTGEKKLEADLSA